MTTSVWDKKKPKFDRVAWTGHKWSESGKCTACHIPRGWLLADKKCVPRPPVKRTKKVEVAKPRPAWFDIGPIELTSKPVELKEE